MRSFRINNKTFQAFIFDMDGVISDTMPYHFRAWRKIFADNGVRVSRFDVYRREGQKGTASIREIFADAGIVISTDQAKKIIADKEKLFKAIVRQRYIPGARALLKDLSRRNIKMALVTGTARAEVLQTLSADLLALFAVTVTGTDVNQGKPHPEPYLQALAKLGVAAKDAVVIENAPFGIISAKSAGICCYALATSLPAEYLKDADKVFKSHKELRNTLCPAYV